MSIIIGGTTVDTVVYNGTTLDEVFYNNTKVYESSIKSVLTVVYGANVSSVSVDGVTIPNGGTFEYKPGDTKNIVVSYSGYVTGDGYVHSVNNNTTLNSTRWKYNTSYTVSGIEKTVTVSTNLVAVSNTIAFTLTDAEVESLPSGTITFNAAKSGTQTYKSKQVQVPYTAYAYETGITFNGYVRDFTTGKRKKYNHREYFSHEGYLVMSTRDPGTGEYIEITVAKFIYNANKHAFYAYVVDITNYVFENLTITGDSGKVYVSNYLGYQRQEGTTQYSYTAYRTETQYYWG